MRNIGLISTNTPQRKSMSFLSNLRKKKRSRNNESVFEKVSTVRDRPSSGSALACKGLQVLHQYS